MHQTTLFRDKNYTNGEDSPDSQWVTTPPHTSPSPLRGLQLNFSYFKAWELLFCKFQTHQNFRITFLFPLENLEGFDFSQNV